MLELLEKYPNKKIILSNANDEQLIPFSLTNLPYEMFTLRHDTDKDNPAYFQKMLKQFNHKPDEIIYFEHDPDAINSAR